MNFLNHEGRFIRITQAALIFCLALVSGTIHAQRDVATSTVYLKKNVAELKVNVSDLDDLQLSHVTRGSGNFQVAYLQQTLKGISIHNRIVNVVYDDGGQILGHSGTLSDNLNQRDLVTTPGLSPLSALSRAAGHLKLTGGNNSILEPGIGVEQKGIISKGSLSMGDITFRLVYQDMGETGLKLAWEFVIYELSTLHWWQIRIDANTGEYLDKNDWVASCKVDHTLTMGRGHIHGAECMPSSPPPLPNSYYVFGMPVESPIHATTPFTRSHETSPWLDGVGSPFGWHDTDGVAGAEFTITQGNNVLASEDMNADNVPGLSPDGGASLDFDFPINFANAPDAYVEAAVTNLFYWNNICHDVLYNYGFDEVSGNFQENNYGNGGLGSDYVNADALDGYNTGNLNNANFGTPPDGANPRMQMFAWSQTSPWTTSDLDNGIIIHEYGHGVSNRLTGGPNTTSCLGNSEQMGEGWSDYLGLIMTMEAGDAGIDSRGIGTYVLGQATNGPGIRQYPYTTDMSVNLHTYGDIGSVAVPHGVGSVWCEMLWEMTWALTDFHGFDPDIYNGTGGNNIALQLVMDGMKLQPCSPGFVDGRDAILLADQINNGGANQCLIWKAFAKRGLGAFADQGSSGSVTDGVEDFSEPCFCDPSNPPVGCTDPVACNFDGGATCDDGTCTYPGCTNPAACNYDPTAGCDDGSCLITGVIGVDLTIITDCWGGEVTWEILDGLGAQVAAGGPLNSLTQYDHHFCLIPGECYTFNIFDSYGDGMNGTAFNCAVDGNYYMYDDLGTLLFEIGPDPDYGFGTSHVFCPGAGELLITKTADSSVDAGTNLTYTVTVENTSLAPATNVFVTDQIPPEVNYIPGSASCTAAFADPTLTLDLGTIPASSQVVCTYEVSVPSSPFTTYLYEDDMEGGVGGFVPSTGIGAFAWSQVTTDANSPVTSWFAEDPDVQSDQYLDLVGIGQLTATSQLFFSHRYDTEADWDGGVIEISTDGGTNWTDLGGLIIQNGYSGLITVNPASPISGQMAFEGNSNGWLETIVDLGSYAGQTVSIRWRMASDAFVGGNGWWVDDVSVGEDVVQFTNNACVTSTEFPTPVCTSATTLVTEPTCTPVTWYADTDGDTYGDAGNTVDACIAPTGYVADSSDCDDNDADKFPGNPEICDGKDNDCDGVVDNGLTFIDYYPDTDGDTFGDSGAAPVSTCDGPPAGHVADNTDCDDADADKFPGNPEVCDGKDNDCDGVVDNGLVFTDYFPDNDGDGFGGASGAPVSTCDGAPAGHVADNTDCDDGNEDVYPGAPSTAEGIDNDCNGIVDPDEAAPCPGDFDGSGFVDVQDLLLFLSDFGCSGTCLADMNNDGFTNSADLLGFLAVYGTFCP